MFKNWFVTLAGIMASLVGVPLAVITYYATIVKAGPPTWFMNYMAFPMVLLGTIGTALMGVAAKGADQHSTAGQIAAATAQATGAKQTDGTMVSAEVTTTTPVKPV
jgi:hypothetical protein